MKILTLLILWLVLGACTIETPIDFNKMIMTNEDLREQKREMEAIEEQQVKTPRNMETNGRSLVTFGSGTHK